jgi:hypothetical protein
MCGFRIVAFQEAFGASRVHIGRGQLGTLHVLGQAPGHAARFDGGDQAKSGQYAGRRIAPADATIAPELPVVAQGIFYPAPGQIAKQNGGGDAADPGNT